MSVFAAPFAALGALLAHCADVLEPLFGGSATAAAIIVFTCCVRLALHPLARSTARGERVRAELAPRLADGRCSSACARRGVRWRSGPVRRRGDRALADPVGPSAVMARSRTPGPGAGAEG
ncbi:hypothetical protein AB0A77_27830 [Streptomyces varsoviensis]|uniref:hypothetical protein n=1 Tax=Streptomyces varsoviensis TaxID=67373 RepID=UPI003406786E